MSDSTPVDAVPTEQMADLSVNPAGEKVSKSALKKQAKLAAEAKRKEERLSKLKTDADQSSASKLEASKSIKIVENASLPAAKRIDVGSAASHIGQRVEVRGWVHHFSRNSPKLMFVGVRDGTGLPAVLQCVWEGELAQAYDAQMLHREATVLVKGTIVDPSASKRVQQPTEEDEKKKLPQVELVADYWELIGVSDGEV